MNYRQNASGGIGEVLKWGLLGVAAYWIYTTFFTTAATPATATPAATPAAAPASTFNTLDAIYSRMVAAVPANTQQTADQWNTVLAAQSAVTPPDPNAVFTFTTANPRTATMTAAQYWTPMSAYLAKNMGMSGLGFYGGFGAFIRRRTRA